MSHRSKNKTLLLGLLLIAAVLLAYQPVWHAGFIWDDDEYVTENPLLSAPDGLRRIWFSPDSPSQYFPLVYTTFRAEYAIWGLNSAGYHWVNIVLHIANALLVWWLLARLKVPGAWLAAAIFALHPVQVESVAWITERKNVLSVFFFLPALLAWTEFIAEDARKKWVFYALALVFYTLALCSKTTACTLPAALLLILWLNHKPIDWRRMRETVPFLALGGGMGLLAMWWERYHQGTQGKLFAMGLAERLLVASHAVWFYASKLLWPVNLTFSYPHWTLQPGNPLAWGWLLADIALCWVIYCAREDIRRGTEVAALFFVATLSPMLGFIMLYTFRYSFVADHYQYAASIGPIALVSAGIVTLAESRKKIRKAIYAGTAVIVLGLGALTWKQCHIYRDAETLWRDTLAKNPGSWMAWNNLGLDLLQKNRVKEANSCFQKALEIKPDFAEVYGNLGNALLQKGLVNEAIAHYRKALEINPDLADVHEDLGAALYHEGKVDEAISEYRKALEIKPDYAAGENNLGYILFQTGHIDEAIVHCQKAIEIKPDYAEAQNNLGDILLQTGRLDEAIVHCQKALQINPDLAEAQYNLGNIFLQKGHAEEAADHYQKALEIQPHNAEIQNNLAYVLATSPQASLRDGARAVELAQQANLSTSGNNLIILGTLAAAYAEAGRFPEAVETAQRALDLANAQFNAVLAARLRSQIMLYQARTPFRDKSFGK